MRHGREGGRDRLRTRFAAAGLVLAAGGCSADVARFDFPTFSLNNDGSGAAPRPSASVRAGAPRLPDDPLRPEGAAQGRGDGDVRIAALPEPSPSELPPANPAAFDPRRIERRPPGAAEVGPSQRGVEIEVQPGDTLYGLSKRHRVSLSELMAVNELAAPSLKPGQRIYLPAGHAPARPLERSRAPEVASARHVDESLGRPAASSTWSGTYTVRPGDSVYAVARRYNVSFAELQHANAITDARRVRPGTVLKVPGAGRDAPLARGRDNAAPQLAPEAAPQIPSTTQPTMINGATRVAALPSLNDASPAPSQPAAGDPVRREEAPSAPNGEVRLRWPVSGRVIAAFGPRSDGTHNDGLNLAVPLGTDVHAAEAGLVAYAGNELKGYGNLVLLRHDNGWVTAYAHNDELLVKRGDKVKRGQVLARAGKTGQVDQPQVHFELRQGSKPVDPTPFLERL